MSPTPSDKPTTESAPTPRRSDSRWLTARRCLAIARRLERGPAGKAELLEAVYAAEGQEAYGLATGRLLTKRFEADKKRLREHLHLDVRYSAAEGGYVLAEGSAARLDLPDEDLVTLAWLADTFEPGSPRAEDVRRLVDRLVARLPEERRAVFRRWSGALPTADLRLRDDEPIAEDVWNAVLAACRARQELRFDHRTWDGAAEVVRAHHVQPWDVELTDRGHWRLRAYCLRWEGPGGPVEPRDYRHYRLSRIVAGSARVLPRVLPPVRPRGRPRRVVFEMSPRIARFGVSARRELLGEPTISPAADGWTRVEGETLDIFDLARNLLYYGSHCRVLGGPELLEEVRGLVAGLGEMYHQPPED